MFLLSHVHWPVLVIWVSCIKRQSLNSTPARLKYEILWSIREQRQSPQTTAVYAKHNLGELLLNLQLYCHYLCYMLFAY